MIFHRPSVHGRMMVLAAGAMALTGCAAVGPNYTAPQVATPSAFTGADAPGASPSGVSPSDAAFETWWRGFHDPVLDGLIERALSENLDVREAISRVRQARDREREARAAGEPSLNASAQASETRLSKNGGLTGLSKSLGGAGGGGTPIGLPGTSFADYQAGFDAAWELDVFGGVRRGVEAARAATAAEQWSVRDAEVTLTAEIASDYIALRGAQARLALARANLTVARAQLSFSEALGRHGLAATEDIARQAARAASVAADPPALQADIMARIDALAVLLGAMPDSLTGQLATPAALPVAPPSIPAGLPSDLLRRRPDIRRAERQLAQATAEVGVAKADLYPSFNLTGAGDLISTSLSNLVSVDSLQGAATGLVRWPILDGGRARANAAAAEEARQQAAIAYRRTVLTALREVEEALARYGAERRRGDRLDAVVAADQRGLIAAQARLHNGLVAATSPLAARATLLDAQDQRTQSVAALGQDVAALYKALGGGWSATDPIAPTGTSR